MKILIVDNNDSFTYNLLDLIRRSTNLKADVWLSKSSNLPELETYDKIILSPGPGLPYDFPAMNNVITACRQGIDLLGICLGHQAIAQYFGSKLENMNNVVHGQPSKIILTNKSKIFANCPDSFTAGLYHSWRIKKDFLADDLVVTATDTDNQIMAFEHKKYPFYGLQFHPESYITQNGHVIIKNFINGL